MEGPVPSETEKETAHRLRPMDTGALTTLGTFAHTDCRKMSVISLDQLTPYQGAAQDELSYGGNSENSWSKHRASQTTRRRSKPSMDVVRPVSRQWLSKHIPVATVTHATREKGVVYVVCTEKL
jgi:hypothetical protein